MNIYKVELMYGTNVPKLFSSAVIKETPKAYLCESAGIATNYSSHVRKSYFPALSPEKAWGRYIAMAKQTLITMHRRIEDTSEAIVLAEQELEKL